MKPYFKTLAFTTTAVVLLLYSQTSKGQGSQSTRGAGTAVTGNREATRMVRARAELMHSLDAMKDKSGSAVQAKLVQTVRLTDGTKLPDGTILVGEVTVDDMQRQGMSKLALRFNQARLKNGNVVPIKATIVGFYGPWAGGFHPYSGTGEVPNSWTDGTLQIDQEGVIADVDLHSQITSGNSGVFVSTRKDDIKLDEGSEIQFAIGPGQ
jgi:hypothetical protein